MSSRNCDAVDPGNTPTAINGTRLSKQIAGRDSSYKQVIDGGMAAWNRKSVVHIIKPENAFSA
jgi:hypothetical protein